MTPETMTALGTWGPIFVMIAIMGNQNIKSQFIVIIGVSSWKNGLKQVI